jgi:5-methylcytosine-specific restriction protein A
VARSQGLCEYCNKAAFVKDDGTAYIETHHIIALAEDGSDRLWNVIALCAGHHREAHFGAHRIKLEQEFMAILKGKICS